MVSRRVDRDQRVRSVAGQLLAAVLRQELDDSGLTKIAFSRKIGVTTQFLDPMLAGSGNPSLITLDTIMRALGSTVVFPRSCASGEGIESHSARALGLVVQRLAMLMREEIETTGETQLELAIRASVSRFYIRKTIHGSANPSILSLETMLKGMGRTMKFPRHDGQPSRDPTRGEPAVGHLHKRHAGGRPPRSRSNRGQRQFCALSNARADRTVSRTDDPATGKS